MASFNDAVSDLEALRELEVMKVALMLRPGSRKQFLDAMGSLNRDTLEKFLSLSRDDFNRAAFSMKHFEDETLVGLCIAQTTPQAPKDPGFIHKIAEAVEKALGLSDPDAFERKLGELVQKGMSVMQLVRWLKALEETRDFGAASALVFGAGSAIAPVP